MWQPPHFYFTHIKNVFFGIEIFGKRVSLLWVGLEFLDLSMLQMGIRLSKYLKSLISNIAGMNPTFRLKRSLGVEHSDPEPDPFMFWVEDPDLGLLHSNIKICRF